MNRLLIAQSTFNRQVSLRGRPLLIDITRLTVVLIITDIIWPLRHRKLVYLNYPNLIHPKPHLMNRFPFSIHLKKIFLTQMTNQMTQKLQEFFVMSLSRVIMLQSVHFEIFSPYFFSQRRILWSFFLTMSFHGLYFELTRDSLIELI